MDNNEIRTIKINMSLKEYISNNDDLTNSFVPLRLKEVAHNGTNFIPIKIKVFKEPLLVELSSGKLYTAIGYIEKYPHKIVCIDISFNIITRDINDLTVRTEVVLKEHIKHLKYKEQLKLFDNGENENTDTK